jgi:uncharacterized membrane protein
MNRPEKIKNIRLINLWTGLMIALALAGVPHAWGDSDTGVIEGKVVNGTDGDIGYENQKVQLLIFSKTRDDMERRETTTAASGAYRFTGLPLGADYVFMVGTEYQNVFYHSDRISLESENESRSVLTVYETTTSDSEISVKSKHLIIDPEAEGYRITEIITINNKGNRTYIGSTEGEGQEGETLFFQLPEGYKEFQFMQMVPQGFIKQKADGFAISEPVLPGTTQTNFTYLLPVFPRRWERAVKFPTENINLLNGDPMLRLTSDVLIDKGPVTFGDKKYSVLAAKDLSAGSSFSLSFKSGKPKLTGGPLARNQGLYALIFIIGLGAVLAVFLVLRKGNTAVSDGEPLPIEGAERHKEELIDYIAALDKRFEEGEISEQDYQRERREKKAQLLEVARLIEQEEAAE